MTVLASNIVKLLSSGVIIAIASALVHSALGAPEETTVDVAQLIAQSRADNNDPQPTPQPTPSIKEETGAASKTALLNETNKQPASSTKAPVIHTQPPVSLRILDKTTGRAASISAPVGEVYIHGRLKIIVRSCWRSPPFAFPETKGFLEIFETIPSGRLKSVFSGWMFSSTPSISAMQHPVYDIWIEDTRDK